MGARPARRERGARRSASRHSASWPSAAQRPVPRRIARFVARLACLIFAVATLALLAACGAPAGLSDEDRSFYEDVASRERDFIYECQTAEGSLLDVPESGGKATINAYEANIAIAGILEGESNQKDLICARHYLQWYGSQMLEGRPIGLPDGVVPDFDVVVEGDYVESMTPVAPRNWDFEIASYLVALGRYDASGGADDFTAARYDEARRALDALLALVGEDGLTRVSGTSDVRYLVNNLEVLAALDETVRLYDDSWIPSAENARAAREQERDELLETANRTRQAIVDNLWDESTSSWYMGLDPEGEPLEISGEDAKFLQAVAQIYPIIFSDVEAAEKDGTPADEAGEILRDAQRHYDDFCAEFQWQDLAPDTYVQDHWWPSVAFAAARMGDYERVHTFLENYVGSDRAASHGLPHSLIEAGWAARTASYLLTEG